MSFIVPLIICIILLYGFIKKVDVVSVFCAGASEGISTVLGIFPMLLLMITAIYMLRSSGAIDFFSNLFSPFFNILGIPPDTAPLVFLKPLSGSGGLAIGSEIISKFGADTYIGRSASVMLAASETSIYTISIYCAHVGINKTRHALPAALIADISVFISAAFFVRLLF